MSLILRWRFRPVRLSAKTLFQGALWVLTLPTLVEFASALIEVFEGCKLKAYRDSGGVWTVGIGHTKGVYEGMVITREQADQFFAEDQAELLTLVADKPIPAAAAMVSFGFNCGRRDLERYLGGELKLMDCVHDEHGNVLGGLVARRRLESMLIALAKGNWT
jgi:GH24 family phage-related lysozyme (muramidase)